MSYKILEPLLHGAGAQIFSLQVGEVVDGNFFTSKQAAHLLEIKSIETCDEPASKKIDSEKVPNLPDITKMTAVDAKLLIDKESDSTKIHKFMDAENGSGKPRKTVLDALHYKIKEMVGYE